MILLIVSFHLQQDIEFSVRVSFVELYNEELFDLLGSSIDPLRLRIYEDNLKKVMYSVLSDDLFIIAVLSSFQQVLL